MRYILDIGSSEFQSAWLGHALKALEMSDEETGRNHVTSLGRVLSVMKILAANPAGLRLT